MQDSTASNKNEAPEPQRKRQRKESGLFSGIWSSLTNQVTQVKTSLGFIEQPLPVVQRNTIEPKAPDFDEIMVVEEDNIPDLKTMDEKLEKMCEERMKEHSLADDYIELSL